MTDQQYTPNVAQVRFAATFPNENFSLRGVDFDRWFADIKVTERLFMLAQIMDVADFDPGQEDEYGRIEIPAYTVIDVHELNEIARLEGHEFMAITVEDLEKHASLIEAAAEQRGAEKALQDFKKFATRIMPSTVRRADVIADLEESLKRLSKDSYLIMGPLRADLLEGDHDDR